MQRVDYHDKISIPIIIPVTTNVLVHRLIVEKERKLVVFLIDKNNNITKIEYDGNMFNKVEYTFQNPSRLQCKEKILTSKGILCVSNNKLYHLYYDSDVVELPFSVDNIKPIVGIHHIFLVKSPKFLHGGKIHIYSLERNDVESFPVNANRMAYVTHPTGSTIAICGSNKFYTIFEKNNSVKIFEERFVAKHVKVGPGIVLASNNRESVIATLYKVEHIPVNLDLYRSTFLLCTPSWKFCIIDCGKDYLVGISGRNDVILRVDAKPFKNRVWLDLKNDAIVIPGLKEGSQIISIPEENVYSTKTSLPIVKGESSNSIYVELAKERTQYIITTDVLHNLLPYTLIIKNGSAYIIDISKYRCICTMKRKPRTNILIINCHDPNIIVEAENVIIRKNSYSKIIVILPYNRYPISNTKIIVKDNILTTVKEISLAHYPPRISINKVSKICISLYHGNHNLVDWRYLKINIGYKNPYATPIFTTLRLSSYTHSQTVQFKLEKSSGQKCIVIEDNDYSKMEIIFANKLLDTLHVNTIPIEKHVKIEILDIRPTRFSHINKPTKFKVIARVYDPDVVGIGLGKQFWSVNRQNNTISFEVEEDSTSSRKTYLLVKLKNNVVKLTLHGLYNIVLSRFIQNLASVTLSELDIMRGQACYKVLSEGYLILVNNGSIIKKWVQKDEQFCTHTTVKLVCKNLRKIELPPLLTNNFKVAMWLEGNTIILKIMSNFYNHMMAISYTNTIKFGRSTLSVKVADLLDAIKDGGQGLAKIAVFNIFVLVPGGMLKTSINFLKLLLTFAFRAANALKTRIQLL